MKKILTEKLREQRKIFYSFVLLGILAVAIYVYTASVHPKIEFELTSTNIGESVCIFYTDGNMENFDDEHMMQDEIVSGTHMYSFDVSDIDRLRIDLGTNVGTSLISDVSVKSFFVTRKASSSYMSTCSFSPDVGMVTVNEGESVLSIESIGTDPYIIMGNIEEFDKTINILEIGILLLAILAIIMASGVIAVYCKAFGSFLGKIFLGTAEKILGCIKKIWSMPFCRCMLFFMLFGIVYLYQAVSSYPKVEFELSSTNIREGICIFYADKKMESFDSEHMIAEAIEFGSQKYSFDVPDIDRLRIDFGENAGSTQISNITVKTFFTTKEVSAQYISGCAFSADVGEVILDGNILQLESIGTDPYVILGTLDDVESIFDWQKAVLLAAAIVLMLVISGVIARYEDVIEKLLNIKKKHAVIISCIIFFVYRIVFMVAHKGFLAIDEFRHISTLNPNFITDYNRAPYVNAAVKAVCLLFGQNDLAVKTVPLIMGTISFLCGVYLLYSIYDNPYWIITISSIFTFIPYISFNHFYIRMYVFLEAIVMLDSLLFYNAVKKKGTKYEKINICAAVVLAILYSLYTKDLSAYALLLMIIVVSLYYLTIGKIGGLAKKSFVIKCGIRGILIIACCIIAIVKKEWIEQFIDGILYMASGDYRLSADSPIFLQLIFVKMFYVSIPFIASMIYIWRKRREEKKILFVIAGLPLLGFVLFFHSAYLVRTYVAFLPILCIVSYLLLDRVKLSRMQHLAIIFVMVALTLNLEDDFWKDPSLSHEIIYSDVGEAFVLARQLEEQGYELIPMMTMETQSAYFDLLDTDINLNMEDIKEKIWLKNNDTDYNRAVYADENLIDEAVALINNEIEIMIRSNNKKVLISDESGIAVFHLICRKEWEEVCEVKKCGENAGIIIVN